MSYGIEAVIPLEIGLPSMRTFKFSPKENDQLMTKQLDYIEENKEIVSTRLADCQQKLSQGYN